MRQPAGAWALALAALCLAALAPAPTSAGAATTASPTAAPSQAAPSPAPNPSFRTPVEIARDAKGFEDAGAFGMAAVLLQRLRGVAKPDADLDLELALDLARAGDLDSARVLLDGPVLSAALADSCPPARRHPYAWNRDQLWTNGTFDGWRWYIARARAEVDARLGHWRAARAAAERALTERPLFGLEWLVLAVCSAHADEIAAAEIQARMAATLDPMLPEALYLAGLFEWRAGKRTQALQRFGAAVSVDSLYMPAVRARQRLRFFPGAQPDSMPGEFLTGLRAAGLLTSPVGPKIEAFQQVEHQAAILSRLMVPIPDTIEVEMKSMRIVLPVLVDERGRAVLCDLPWFSENDLPAPFVTVLMESLPGWRFAPATVSGKPVPSWAGISITTGSR
jgi:hypothetical protein